MDTGRVSVAENILEAAVARLVAEGPEAVSISGVAAGSGVSRPTVYAHFGSREQLLSQALQRAATRVITHVTERARGATTAADYIVEMIVAARAEFRSQPAMAPIAFPTRGGILFDGDALGPSALAMARSFLEPAKELEPRLSPEMSEIAEVCTRWLLSVVLFDSERSSTDDRLRGFLRRRLVPSLGL